MTARTQSPIPRLGWIIAGLLLVVTLINYADRSTMAVLVKQIRDSLHLSENDYSQIVSFFLIAYAIMYVGSGWVVDRIGTRWGMALFVCFWSVCQMLHGFATGKWTFAACRFGLGLAEPGSFPAAVKAIGEWFPPAQRALGVGIFNAGSSLGAAAAPPLAAWLALHYGWRAAFWFTGGLGLVWLLFWLTIYRPPAGTPVATMEKPEKSYSSFKVVLTRAGIMLVLARFLTDPVIYFVIFWLPAYLEKDRGFDLKMIQNYAWVPYAFGGIGYLIGGAISGWLVRRGMTITRARKTAMAIGAAFLPAAILAPLVPSAGLAIAAMCMVVFGHAIWIANLMALPADLFPKREVGTAAGYSGMGGAIAGALANWYTGAIIVHYSYLPIFICAGLLHPIAIVLVWWLLSDRIFGGREQAGNAE